jgi:hypothetical protein
MKNLHIMHTERNFKDDVINGADIKRNGRGYDIKKTTNEYGEFWVISDGMHSWTYPLDKYPTKDNAWAKWENDLM